MPRLRPLIRRRRLATLGQPPGTILPDPNAAKPRLTVVAYGPDRLEERSIATVEELKSLTGQFPVVWLNVDGLGDPSVVSAIGRQFTLHDLALEDVMNPHQRPKAESYPGYEFMTAQMANAGESLDLEQFSLFLGKNFVVTFQERPGDCFGPVRERIRKSQGIIRRQGPDYLAYSLIDALVDSFFPSLERYGEQIDAMEDLTLTNRSGTHIRQLHAMKRELFALRRAVWPLRDAISHLMHDGSNCLSPETRLHLRDAYDHTVQIIDLLETYRELCSDLIDLYLSSISARMNEVMRVLTIIATIFIPTTFIASIYGMNFQFMPELHWRHGYLFALSLMALVAFVLLAFFWRRGWLRSFYPSSSNRP